jgi:hypothetical protein
MSSTDFNKLAGIQAGAEVNQDAWSYFVVAGTTISAGVEKDTFTFVQGSNITLTPNTTTKQIEIAATGSTGVSSVTGTAPIQSSGGTTPDISISAANSTQAGSMSSTDFNKLAGIQAGAEVNQNAWSYFVVGGSTVSADSKTDTATFIGDGGVTITPNTSTDSLTFFGANIANTDLVLTGARTLDLRGNTLDVNDTATFVAEFASGAVSIGQELKVLGTASLGGLVSFFESAGGPNYVGLRAPTLLNTDTIWTLPSGDGSSGQALVTNGSGTLSFANRVQSVTASSPIVSSGGLTPLISILPANSTQTGSMSSTNFSKLAGIQAGAEVNQDAWSYFVVAGTTISASAEKDTFTFVQGSNITLTPDTVTKQITIAATGSTGVSSVTGTAPISSTGGATPDISISAANSTQAGSMSSTDFNKLAGIQAGAEVNQDAWSYFVVQGTTISASAEKDTFTFVQGSNITLTPNTTTKQIEIAATGSGGGVTSVSGTAPISSTGGATPDISISAANSTQAGSMSSSDFNKLAGIEAGAEVNQNAWSYFVVQSTTVSADTKMDTVTFVGDGGLTITPNTGSDSLTFFGAMLANTDQDLEAPRTIDLKSFTLDIIDVSRFVASFAGGIVTVGEVLQIDGSNSNGGIITLYEARPGTNYIQLKAPNSLTVDTTYTLPSADGTSGQVMSTNGSGALSFVTRKATVVSSKTVGTGAWSLVSGFYEASISDSAISSTSIVDVIPNNASAATAAAAGALPQTDSSAGAVKIYATSAPTTTLTVTLNVYDLGQ